ncbi:unnamed protein product [Cunninghamella blakesleeana]
MSLPNELLYIIFQILTSRRDLVKCSSVNKQWHSVATHDSFFNHINIYNKKQFDLFLKSAKEMKINHQSMGEHVQHLNIHLVHSIDDEKMRLLQTCCPNIITIKYNAIEDDDESYDMIGMWPQLTHWPIWYKNPTLKCLSYWKSTIEKVDHWMDRSTRYLDEDGILLTRLQTLQTLNNLSILKLRNYDRDYFHFPIEIRLSFLKLIHINCPHLKTLSISYGIEFKSYNNDPSTFDHHLWNIITELEFKTIKINSSNFFKYISNCYLNLISLKLENIHWGIEPDNEDDFEELSIEWSTIIMEMVIKLINQLKLFHISFNQYKYFRKCGLHLIWPNKELLEYLHSNPSDNLKDLKWPSTIYHCPIQERENFQQHAPLYQEVKPISFIHHLETLHLSLPYITNVTLNYLLDGQKNRILTNIKQLYISPIKFSEDIKPRFYLYKWLDGFPNLQSLSINCMNLITFEPFINEDKQQQQQTHSKYKLKKLVIKSSDIYFEGGFSQLFQYCRQLNHFECTQSLYNFESFIHDENIVNELQVYSNTLSTEEERCYYNMLIYAPHMTLDTLILTDMNYCMGQCMGYDAFYIKSKSATFFKWRKFEPPEYEEDEEHYWYDKVYLVILFNDIGKYWHNKKCLIY